ncbi:hypothetical protein [Chishuiella sp.]|uniref:hypothetical protein n=1 Tax=Chishuiella sp. TaxID=1969467 RepID=UPI0028AA9BC6|nr:hypothetical protein [Chishuiella sp.]
MRSTYGTRASICNHFNWTLDYLENGISWAKVQRLIADMSSDDYDDKESDSNNNTNNSSQSNKSIKITEQNAGDILKIFQ